MQFVRFLAVGATAFAVDACIHYLLMFVIQVQGVSLSALVAEKLVANLSAFGLVAHPYPTAFAFFKVISTILGIVVSFNLNRLWTFSGATEGPSLRQLRRYVAVVSVGLVLNTTISSLLDSAMPFDPRVRWAIATVAATAVVSFWNFNGHKRWSFAPRAHAGEVSERERALGFRWAILGLLALGSTAALLSLRLSIQHDGPVVMYPAWLVWTGQKNLYRDLFDFNLPGSYGVYGLIGLITGFRDLPVQMLHLVLLGGLGLITLRVAGKPLRLAGALAFAVYLAILFSNPKVLTLQREFFILLLTVGAVSVAVNRPQSVRSAFLIGLMGGYATLIKPHALVAFLIVFAFRMVWEETLRLRITAAFVVGWLLPVVLGIGIVAASGGLGELISIFRDYVPLYGEMTGSHEILRSGERTDYLLTNFLGSRYTKLFLLLMIVGSLLIRRERSQDGQLARLSALLACVAGYFLLYPALSGQFWPYHYLPFHYFSAFLVAVTMHVLAKRTKKPILVHGYLLAAFVTLWSVGLGTLRQLATPVGLQRNDSAFMIRDFLSEHLRPGETVQPLDWTVGCVDGMLRARAPLATRFIYDFSFYHHVSSETIRDLRHRFIAEFDASRPSVVLQAYGPEKPRPHGIDTSSSFPELDMRLKRDYLVAKQDDEVRILVRKDRVLQHSN